MVWVDLLPKNDEGTRGAREVASMRPLQVPQPKDYKGPGVDFTVAQINRDPLLKRLAQKAQKDLSVRI